jgi:hypothetical protein
VLALSGWSIGICTDGAGTGSGGVMIAVSEVVGSATSIAADGVSDACAGVVTSAIDGAAGSMV